MFLFNTNNLHAIIQFYVFLFNTINFSSRSILLIDNNLRVTSTSQSDSGSNGNLWLIHIPYGPGTRVSASGINLMLYPGHPFSLRILTPVERMPYAYFQPCLESEIVVEAVVAVAAAATTTTATTAAAAAAAYLVSIRRRIFLLEVK